MVCGITSEQKEPRGERMRKKGEKGAPTQDQIKRFLKKIKKNKMQMSKIKRVHNLRNTTKV